MILYKYLHPDRAADLLQHRLIRFTQPSSFNDPFDSKPCFDSVVESEFIEEVCQLDDPEETQRFRAQVIEAFQEPEVKDWYTSGTLNNIAILCLAERPENILMWAHYARSDQGLVVGLDVDHASLKNRADGETRRCQKVSYTLDRPKRETLTELTAQEAFYSKSPEWGYEQEWRILDGVVHADEVRGADKSVYLFRFDPQAVREVILGARMQEESVRLVTDALKHQDYKHVRLQRAEMHPEQYRVTICDV